IVILNKDPIPHAWQFGTGVSREQQLPRSFGRYLGQLISYQVSIPINTRDPRHGETRPNPAFELMPKPLIKSKLGQFHF
ncbi:MAG TPA: hypothetical protein VMH23_13885, partial [Bacteroidota bacterium]|nr:hypothetical protein [Bacteroidota bacterium]